MAGTTSMKNRRGPISCHSAAAELIQLFVEPWFFAIADDADDAEGNMRVLLRRHPCEQDDAWVLDRSQRDVHVRRT